MKRLSLLLIALLLLTGCANTAGKANNTQAPTREAAVTTAGTKTDTTEATISPEEAEQIALQHAGLTADQVRDLHAERDRDGGRLHYDVEFEEGRYEYDYEIDAADGKILFSEKDGD